MHHPMPQWLTPLWRQLLLALIYGASLTLAYAPFNHHLLVYFTIPLWLYLLLRTNAPFLVGLAFGLGWFGAGISWVHVSIADYGGVPILVSLGLMALLCAYLALYPALFGFLINRINQASQQQVLPVIMCAPVLWYVIEWLRGVVLTGFPWLSLGYSQVSGLGQHMIPIFGELGTSALIMFIAICVTRQTNFKLFHHLINPKSNGLFALGLTLAVMMNYINWTWPTTTSEKPVNIAMVQGNIPQSLRWLPEEDANTMRKYVAMTEALWDTADVIIWPEAAIPQLEPLAQEYLNYLKSLSTQYNTPLVTGILNYKVLTEQAFNNVIVLDSNYSYEHANRYAKHHLLPIGEFVPFENILRGLAPIFDLPMSSFTRGEYIQAPLVAEPLHMTTALCYEILFAQQVRENVTDTTNAILTLSNDAWFGASHGPHQHMQIAQTRALELGLPVLRATNNGITAITDARGNILAQAEQFSDTHLSYALPLERRYTPYSLYGELLNWIWLGLFTLVAVYCYNFTKKLPTKEVEHA